MGPVWVIAGHVGESGRGRVLAKMVEVPLASQGAQAIHLAKGTVVNPKGSRTPGQILGTFFPRRNPLTVSGESRINTFVFLLADFWSCGG